ncbi:MAG: nucleotidyl transferase AbiEii/AbiGii toxin family protein [Actinomycetota bacterium]|nr:nucleotidyl transferase AbiEii/AbiGii toxin family protein [Actinomycetota bacterium]
MNAGLGVEARQDSPGFVRLQVSSEDEVCEVDLAYDARLREPQATSKGLVLADEELAADKMLALFGRAAGRDYADVYALLDRFSPSELMLAATKDPGFTPRHFVEAIEALVRLREDFPVDDATLAALYVRVVPQVSVAGDRHRSWRAASGAVMASSRT